MVRASYLSPNAGLPFDTSGVHAVAGPTATGPIPVPSPESETEDPSGARRRARKGGHRKEARLRQVVAVDIARAARAGLEEHAGSVATAARSLGMQRTQMYRQMDRWSIKRPPPQRRRLEVKAKRKQRRKRRPNPKRPRLRARLAPVRRVPRGKVVTYGQLSRMKSIGDSPRWRRLGHPRGRPDGSFLAARGQRQGRHFHR